MELCLLADVAASVTYFPARQSVHTFAVLLLHFPATQIAHAIVDAEVAVPATHDVHEAPPVLFNVSVTDPALQLRHLPMELCSAAVVAASVRYFPARQRERELRADATTTRTRQHSHRKY